MPLIARDGKLLRTATGLASSLDCCCGDPPPPDPCNCNFSGEDAPTFYVKVEVQLADFVDYMDRLMCNPPTTCKILSRYFIEPLNGTYMIPLTRECDDVGYAYFASPSSYILARGAKEFITESPCTNNTFTYQDDNITLRWDPTAAGVRLSDFYSNGSTDIFFEGGFINRGIMIPSWCGGPDNYPPSFGPPATYNIVAGLRYLSDCETVQNLTVGTITLSVVAA